MSEELQTPAPGEAGDESAEQEAIEPQSEATENTEGQVKDQPAEEEGETPDTEEETRSKARERRERRKAENEKLRSEARELRERLDRAQQRLTQYEQPEQQPPRYEDFNDHDAYMAALSAHHAGKALDGRFKSEAQREAEEAQRQFKSHQERLAAEAQRNWATQQEDARRRYADFDNVATAPDVPISQEMAQQIMQSDIGADVAYHLGTNKAQAEAIFSMAPSEQVGAMRMLEQFVAISAPRPRTKTSAPDPVTTVKAKSTGLKPIGEMSMDEYMAARKAGKIK